VVALVDLSLGRPLFLTRQSLFCLSNLSQFSSLLTLMTNDCTDQTITTLKMSPEFMLVVTVADQIPINAC